MTLLIIRCPRCAWTGSTDNELATHHLDAHERPLPDAAHAWCAAERWRTHGLATPWSYAQSQNGTRPTVTPREIYPPE